MVDDRGSQPEGKFSLPPLEEQADVLLSPEEWEHLQKLLEFPPKALPSLKRAMARKR
jgi:uncharacterized protein (DUF1778 family)